MDYVNERCVLCGEYFKKDDDIVVCPECGSPHHRDCYKKNNACANIALHQRKEEWIPERTKNKDYVKINEFMICPVCNAPYNNGYTKCAKCGADLIPLFPDEENTENRSEHSSYSEKDLNAFDMPASYLGFNPNEDMGGATIKEISQFVGTNTIYYIPIFKKMKDIGSKISFNISCFIFPSFYFANRRMWLWAMLTTIISIVLNIPTAILMMSEQQLFTNNVVNFIYNNQPFLEEIEIICGVGQWVMRLVLCMFANWIYFRYALKKIKKIKSSNHDGAANSFLVSVMGGVRPANIVIITLITMSFSIAAMLGITVLLNMITLIV